MSSLIFAIQNKQYPCNPCIRSFVSPSVTFRYSYHRNSHTQSWTTHFIANINHHPDYFRIQPSLPNKPWFANFPSLSRGAIVSICRLHFGHHCLPATLARFLSNVSPYCPLHPTTFTLAISNHIFLVWPELQANIKNFEHNIL